MPVILLEDAGALIGLLFALTDVSAIHAALTAEPGVTKIIHLRTMHLGPEELMVAAKISVSAADDAARIATIIDAAEARIRAAVPMAKVVYLEPDIYRKAGVAP